MFTILLVIPSRMVPLSVPSSDVLTSPVILMKPGDSTTTSRHSVRPSRTVKRALNVWMGSFRNCSRPVSWANCWRAGIPVSVIPSPRNVPDPCRRLPLSQRIVMSPARSPVNWSAKRGRKTLIGSFSQLAESVLGLPSEGNNASPRMLPPWALVKSAPVMSSPLSVRMQRAVPRVSLRSG